VLEGSQEEVPLGRYRAYAGPNDRIESRKSPHGDVRREEREEGAIPEACICIAWQMDVYWEDWISVGGNAFRVGFDARPFH
jgi:hypothetical protein